MYFLCLFGCTDSYTTSVYYIYKIVVDVVIRCHMSWHTSVGLAILIKFIKFSTCILFERNVTADVSVLRCLDILL